MPRVSQPLLGQATPVGTDRSTGESYYTNHRRSTQKGGPMNPDDKRDLQQELEVDLNRYTVRKIDFTEQMRKTEAITSSLPTYIDPEELAQVFEMWQEAIQELRNSIVAAQKAMIVVSALKHNPLAKDNDL